MVSESVNFMDFQYEVQNFLETFNLTAQELRLLLGWPCLDISALWPESIKTFGNDKMIPLKLLLEVPINLLKLIELSPDVLTSEKAKQIANKFIPDEAKSKTVKAEAMSAKWLVFSEEDFLKFGKITFYTEDRAKELAVSESNETGQKRFIAKICMLAIPPSHDVKLVGLSD